MLRILPFLLIALTACEPVTTTPVSEPPAARPAPGRAAEIAAIEAEAAAQARASMIPTAISDVDWTLTVLNNRVVGRVMEVDLSGGQIDGMGPCQSIRGNYFGTGPIFVVETIEV